MEEAWMKFMTTGSVTDYLTFKGIASCDMPAESSNSTTWGKEQDGTEYCVDRNGLKCDASWRV